MNKRVKKDLILDSSKGINIKEKLKLFTFLIIDDDIITSKFESAEYYDSLIKKTKNNRIYYYKADKSIVLMSYKYPNIKKGGFRDEETCEWAYVLIDNDEVVSEHKNWSANADKRGDCIHYRVLQNDLALGYNHNLRIGGHVGSGTEGITTCKLHKAIIKSKESREKIEAERTRVSQKSKEVINTIELLWSFKNSRVHHRGHSFDNRIAYLEHVDLSAHRIIHNKWEKNNNLFRPKKIQLGEYYTESLHCNCTSSECENCSSVIRIKTEQQLIDFIDHLNCDEYKELEKRIVPDEYYQTVK